VIVKSYIVEQNLEILDNYQAVLLYGENDGLKDDIKNKLKERKKNTEIINFFESDIIKKKNILYENIINESLFNEEKIIFIQSATDKILNEISEGIEKNNKNIKLYIFSDNLEKKSKLRNLFETNKETAILACYADNERTLVNYISKELKDYKGMTGELINTLIINSSLNRKVIQNEIVKIKSFFLSKKISKLQLLEILNIKNDTSFEEIRDAALMGKIDKINKLLSEIDILNEDSFFYLNNLNHRILKLIEIQNINKVFNNYEETLEKIKPPIFWKDKPIFLQQVKKWNIEKLNKIANKIGDIEILMKKNTKINNDVVLKDLIINLSREASTSS
jgi:DNA polymerase-3 subunit delta|tara:strand:+ start:125 stop:1129 length:1005 start_codon:yes stop_codon:yes gene_type:complete